MRSKRNKFWSHDNRFRLMLTLGLAVLLPAAALIYVNFQHVESIKRDKKVEALIHRDFQYVLAVSEKKLNQKAYAMTEELRDQFPSPDIDNEAEKLKQLDLLLSKNPWLAHVFIFDHDKGMLFRSQPQMVNDPYCRKEHDMMSETYSGWFGMEGKMLVEGLHKKNRPFSWYGGQTKRAGVDTYITTAFFVLPKISKDRVVLGGASFDPDYMKRTFFPETLDELITKKLTEDKDAGANTGVFDNGPAPLAMMVYPTDGEPDEVKPVATSAGWGKGKPEITRKLDDVFRGLALGIKFQGTSAEAIGRRWVMQSFLILGVLSLFMVGGLVLTYRSVSKEMALAHLKADFVSNVSHELRTPLALIRLYAETLELGRITTQEKKEDYYRIIRKESERLTALINNILDFSRIEAGRKEYDFRETDIADLVRNTLDAYRYQIEQQGFAFEQSIDSTIPRVRVDREAIARALVNLVNNALKYSANEKFLGVKLYRANNLLKLEVVDRGIGITRREQSKIFEKFYRTGDPLVHNTKGSGLGLSLVRHITQAHGGEVHVESTPGKGSKFTLSLPLAAT
jgi:signal transduction histidine kinase